MLSHDIEYRFFRFRKLPPLWHDLQINILVQATPDPLSGSNLSNTSAPCFVSLEPSTMTLADPYQQETQPISCSQSVGPLDCMSLSWVKTPAPPAVPLPSTLIVSSPSERKSDWPLPSQEPMFATPNVIASGDVMKHEDSDGLTMSGVLDISSSTVEQSGENIGIVQNTENVEGTVRKLEDSVAETFYASPIREPFSTQVVESSPAHELPTLLPLPVTPPKLDHTVFDPPSRIKHCDSMELLLQKKIDKDSQWIATQTLSFSSSPENAANPINQLFDGKAEQDLKSSNESQCEIARKKDEIVETASQAEDAQESNDNQTEMGMVPHSEIAPPVQVESNLVETLPPIQPTQILSQTIQMLPVERRSVSVKASPIEKLYTEKMRRLGHLTHFVSLTPSSRSTKNANQILTPKITQPVTPIRKLITTPSVTDSIVATAIEKPRIIDKKSKKKESTIVESSPLPDEPLFGTRTRRLAVKRALIDSSTSNDDEPEASQYLPHQRMDPTTPASVQKAKLFKRQKRSPKSPRSSISVAAPATMKTPRAKTSSILDKSIPTLTRGARVWARWSQDDYYYPAVIVSVDGKQYTVRFEDGSVSSALHLCYTSHFEVGDAVDAMIRMRGSSVLFESGFVSQVLSRDAVEVQLPKRLLVVATSQIRIQQALFDLMKQRVLLQNNDSSIPNDLFVGLEFVVESSQETKSNILSWIRQGGGLVLDELDLTDKERVAAQLKERTILLVTTQPSHSLQYMLALAVGIPRVSIEWLKSCISQKSRIPFESFSLSNGFSLEMNAHVACLSPRRLEEFVFNNKIIMISSMEMQVWAPVIEAAGGRAVLAVANTPFHVALGDKRNELLRHVPIVSLEWLFQCLINQRWLFPIHERYLIKE